MKKQFDNYEINDDKKALQIEVVHAFFKNAYWSKGIPQATIQNAIEGFLCFGVYKDTVQVGFARVITDGALLLGY